MANQYTSSLGTMANDDVTIRNDVNLKKETLKLEPDLENAGQFLVSFTFDATVSGRITIVFFAKESEGGNLTATKEDILPPITIDFEEGLGQKFKQPSGSGIDFTAFEDDELLDADIYPLAVKAGTQITQAVYDKDKIRVVKQILWNNGMRYELHDILGNGNMVYGDENSADPCVLCLSEPRDTVVLPCRHLCLCNGCAKALKSQCPICRQPVERLLEIAENENNIG